MGRDYEEQCALSVLRGGGGNGSNSAVPNRPLSIEPTTITTTITTTTIITTTITINSMT